MLQNVTVKNKITGEHLGIFESLSESETDQKNAIKARFGSGAFKLHWGKWKTENGKKVFRPTSRVIYISENGVIQPEVASKIQQPLAGVQLDANSAMMLQMIMQRLDEQLNKINDRLDSIMIQLEEGFYEDDEAQPQEGVPATAPAGDLMSDPRYAGLFGAIMMNANDTDKMLDALKDQLAKDPTIIQGLMMKMMGGAS